MIIELLKLSAIAFRSYMPEMKLKNQNLLFNFKTSIKSFEVKLNIIEKLDECLSKFGLHLKTPQLNSSYLEIKNDVKKSQDEIFLYESEINCLTNKINEIDNLEFLIQNSTLTARWKKEADAYTHTAQKIHDEFIQKKKELRYKSEQEKFETNKFTEFKINNMAKTKDEASKLYQEVIIVHFYDFYLKFEKWMSDLIRLHNDIMSVQKKLVDCEKEMTAPFERLDKLLDNKISNIIETVVLNKTTNVPTHLMNGSRMNISAYSPSTPSNTLSSSFNGAGSKDSSESITSESRNSSLENTNASNSRSNSRHNLDSFISGLKEFKSTASEIEKALDENSVLLKFLHDQFRSQSEAKNTPQQQQQLEQQAKKV